MPMITLIRWRFEKHSRSKLAALGLLLALLLSGCQRQAAVAHEQFIAFGTLVEIKLYGVDEETAQNAIRAVEKDFQYLHRAWHAWESGPVTRINRFIAEGQSVSISPSTIPLIKRAKQLSAASDGLFNPAIGALLQLWGFQGSEPPTGPPPSDEKIQAILAAKPSMDDIHLEGITLSCTNPAVKLDFGGFAKGVGVDYAIQHLRDFGIQNAVVNAGGDLRAIGRHGDRAWRVGIRNPRDSGILAAIDVQGDESIFTSGDYERFFTYEGKRYIHIIDPRSGYPATQTRSVTVVDTDAGRADAAATALFVAGPEHWYEIAKKMGIKGALLVDQQGVVHMTPNLKQRIYFHTEPKPTIVYSDPL